MGLILFLVYLGASLLLLAAFTWLYIRVTPYDEVAEINAGHAAPAISLSGAMLGFTFPLLVASYTHSELTGFLAWGFLSCLVQFAVFWLLHTVLPRVIETNNTAGAICFATTSICAGLINAASFLL